MSNIAGIKLLETANSQPLGIRELAKTLHHRPETIISIVREMEDQGLIRREIEKRTVRGRPKNLIKLTNLGEDYLSAYKTLELKPMRSRKTDLLRAKSDAEYTMRLMSRNLSPLSLFLELNSVVTTHSESTT